MISKIFPQILNLAGKLPKNNMKKKDLHKQVGGSHYKHFKIQPIEYIIANNLLFPEACVVKYVSRHSKKNGKEDILKAIQNLEFILQRDYSN